MDGAARDHRRCSAVLKRSRRRTYRAGAGAAGRAYRYRICVHDGDGRAFSARGSHIEKGDEREAARDVLWNYHPWHHAHWLSHKLLVLKMSPIEIVCVPRSLSLS